MPTRAARRTPSPPASPAQLARLQAPGPDASVLSRPRLTDTIVAQADRALTLVVADAGYGKTTLLAQAGRSLRRPILWYSLTSADADPVVFTRHCVAAFRRDTPAFGRDVRRMLDEIRPGPRIAEHLGGVLSNAFLALTGPTRMFVLDDMHEIPPGSPVLAMIEGWLAHPPPRVRFWIAGRSEPPLALHRLRARGQLLELNSADLAFDRDELERLFRDVFARPLGAADLTALEEATRGWPTAVRLIHEGLARRPDWSLREILASVDATGLDMAGFLSGEVYERLDDAERRLLERTILVPRFDAELARALTGIGDARGRLAGLAHRGLLRSFGASVEATYAASEIVRHFVREQLERRLGRDGMSALEAETARALESRGEAEKALPHALRAGDVEQARRLVARLVPEMLGQGRAAALLAALQELPGAALEADLGLRLARADAQQALGQWNDAATGYEAVLEGARAAHDRATELRALLGLGKVLNLRGNHEQVLGMAERGLALAGHEAVGVRARLLQMKAAAHFYLGHLEASIALLDEVRSLVRESPDPDLLVPTIHNLAIAYASRGWFKAASREFRAALEQVRGGSSPRAALYLSNLSTLLLETGELPEARAAAEESLAVAQRYSNRMHETMAQEALAEVLAHTGDLDGALAALHRAEELNADMRMEVLTADLLALRARIFCARGQYLRAVQFLTRAIEHLAERPNVPRLVAFRALLAWCELRAGRPHVAQEQLLACLPSSDAGENDDHRMRVHYWLAEARLALGPGRAPAAAKAIEQHLETALRLVREHGYEYFLRLQAREEPACLLFALGAGIEIDTCATALVEAGPRVEAPLLSLLARAGTPVGEATLSILGEIGGPSSLERLRTIAGSRRALAPAARTAARHIEERLARTDGGAGAKRRGKGTPGAGEAGAVRLVLFGPPHVEVGGQAIAASAWRTQRAFQMLILLALRPRGVAREELLEAFWPGRRAAAGRRNFHPTLSYLRSVMPARAEPLLLRDSQLYRIHPGYGLTCDLWEFDAAVDDARRGSAGPQRGDALSRAVVLAERTFLEGIYEPWAEDAIGHTRDRLESVLIECGERRVAEHDDEGALSCFRRAAALDEYRESTRVSLIDCLVRTGSRKAAVVEYDRLRDLLRRELAVDPLPETTAAIERALAAPKTIAAQPRDGIRSHSRRPNQIIAAQSIGESAQVTVKATEEDWEP